MEDKLVTLINRYKSGETNAFIDIQNKMNPLITKYSIILCFRDFEDFQDMYSELTLALLECINNMKYYENEHEILYYINRAIVNKFHELYRLAQKQLRQIPTESKSIESLKNLDYYQDTFSSLIFESDILSYISRLPDNKQKIAYSILIEELTDIEVGEKYHITRQYVHRLRKLFYTELLCEFT